MPTWSRDGETSRTLVGRDPELVKLSGREPPKLLGWEPTKLFSLSGLEEGACSLLAEKDWVRGEVTMVWEEGRGVSNSILMTLRIAFSQLEKNEDA